MLQYVPTSLSKHINCSYILPLKLIRYLILLQFQTKSDSCRNFYKIQRLSFNQERGRVRYFNEEDFLSNTQIKYRKICGILGPNIANFAGELSSVFYRV